MKYHVLKPINVAGLGRIPPGRELELHASVAALYLPSGAIEAVQTRELRENPVQPAGAPSSASQAGQASPQTTAKPFDAGDLETKPEPQADTETKPKRRGKPPKSAPSS
ncbi:MAG: hypothetical protein PWP11_3351 [Thauera sp.]|nr:hypothetical protein [Thauera sp.]MDI3492074.1 hypothetical protein [Thauera sp.]